MGLKIHDFCAVRIRCLVIVEIICLIFFAAGCTGKTVEGVKEDFPFETVQLASEYGTLYIQASSYSEEIGKEILQQFDTDVETAVQRTGCGGADVLLCIADSATASYYADADEWYCSAQQIQSGAYRKRLLEELYDLHDYGTLVGLARAVYDPESTGADFKAYYADEDHLSVLSLFAAYFIDDFTNRETVEMAECTAGEFVGYLLENGGLDRVIASPFSESDRNEWLRAIDVAAEYRNLYGMEFLEDAIYRENYRYPLIMRHGVHQYNFLPLRSFATPVEVWKALSQYAEGMQTLWDHLAEYAPSTCERIRTRWALPMTTSFTAVGESQEKHGGIVTVARPMDWLHETIHFLLEREMGKDPAWTQEGMTTYLSSLTGQTFDGDNYYALLTLDYSKIADSPSKTIALQLVEYYHTHWLQESYNPLTYYRALGLFREAAEEAGAEDFRPIVVSCGERRNELSGGNFTEENGNELSYYQAMLVVDYLVEQHGLDAVLEAFFEDEDFPESFGLTYQEALHAAETSFS